VTGTSEICSLDGPLRAIGWAPDAPVDEAGLRQALDRLARRQATGGLAPLLERLYVEPDHVERVLALRAEAWTAAGLDPATPLTCVANRSCLGGLCAGIQLLAWETGGMGRVRSLAGDEGGGRLLDLGRSRALFLADLAPDPSAADPLRGLFDRASALLGRRAMTFRDVGRTWLYVGDLLPVYDHLNRVRDAVFVEQGLGEPGAFVRPPASTGIQGFHPDGAPCFAELIAVRDMTGRDCFEPLVPELQCEALDYGSSFSRGGLLRLGASTLATVSGTASIGADGQSLHDGDPVAQIRETLHNVESLLAACALPPRAHGLWTLYFKDVATFQAWRALVDGGEVEDIEGACVIADVCRPELLFELEVTAAS